MAAHQTRCPALPVNTRLRASLSPAYLVFEHIRVVVHEVSVTLCAYFILKTEHQNINNHKDLSSLKQLPQ